MSKTYKLNLKPPKADYLAFEYKSHSESFKDFKRWCEGLIGPQRWGIYRFWMIEEDLELKREWEEFGDCAVLKLDFDPSSITERDNDCEIHSIVETGRIWLEPISECKRRGLDIVLYDKKTRTFEMARKKDFTREYDFVEVTK